MVQVCATRRLVSSAFNGMPYSKEPTTRQSALLNDAPHLNTWLGRFAIPPGSVSYGHTGTSVR